MNTVSISRHAIDEAVRDFRVDRRVAEQWVRSTLKKAQFVANIISEEGEPQRLFAHHRAAFVLKNTEDFVITCYPVNHGVTALHTKIKAAAMRELTKAERKERATERRVRIDKARLNVEKAACAYKMEITPSRAVIAANTKRIAEINEMLTKLDAELLRVKKEKKAVAKSIVMFL